MTLSLNPKEELRLQMADLEKKLAESEEERFKLEKTCNVLMRAFREGEKTRYKALSKNYEKFLQECSVRKRRNDIILRSLCRIEDRSKALFAKTERLKLLRDRYISYLKISDFKDGVYSPTWRTFQSSLPTQKNTIEVHPKYVQWKTPLATHLKIENTNDVEENSIWSNKTSDVAHHYLVSNASNRNLSNTNEKGREEIQEYENEKINETSVIEGISHIEARIRSSGTPDKLWRVRTEFNYPLGNTDAASLKSEESNETNNQKKSEINDILKDNTRNELEVKVSLEDTITKEKKEMSHQKSIEKLKKALSLEEGLLDREKINKRVDPHEKKILGKEEMEQNEKNLMKKENNFHDASFPRINHDLMNSSSSDNFHEVEKQDNHENDDGRVMKTYSREENFSSRDLPMGLDGVDYQNETYPESYYEQPIHHNHTSIVADVILEEDETEQDVEEEEKNLFDEVQSNRSFEHKQHVLNSWKESSGQTTFDNLEKTEQEITTNNDVQLMYRVHDMNKKAIDEVRNQESDSEKLSQRKQSDVESSESKSEQSEKFLIEKNIRKKNVRSNLIHLLESDSESFQIEHGDAVSPNEDSDFDFSFH